MSYEAGWEFQEFQDPAPVSGRQSHAENDDDYDYALELQPDNEYRTVADILPSIGDYSDLDTLKRREKSTLTSFGEKFNEVNEVDSDDENFIDDLEQSQRTMVRHGAISNAFNGVLRSFRPKLKCEDTEQKDPCPDIESALSPTLVRRGRSSTPSPIAAAGVFSTIAIDPILLQNTSTVSIPCI